MYGAKLPNTPHLHPGHDTLCSSGLSHARCPRASVGLKCQSHPSNRAREPLAPHPGRPWLLGMWPILPARTPLLAPPPVRFHMHCSAAPRISLTMPAPRTGDNEPDPNSVVADGGDGLRKDATYPVVCAQCTECAAGLALEMDDVSEESVHTGRTVGRGGRANRREGEGES